jgi:hypothetical protein
LSDKSKIPLRILKLQKLFNSMGKLGQRLSKMLAMYSLYLIFTNGGAEALAVICHNYILAEAQKRLQEKTNVKHTARTSHTAHAPARAKN